MAPIRRRVLISGMVQGVFFRAYTRDVATSAGVTGWVRNLPDGRVEAVFEGEPDDDWSSMRAGIGVFAGKKLVNEFLHFLR